MGASGLEKCAVCGKPVSKKKLVLLNSNRPAHRGCRPLSAPESIPVRTPRSLATQRKKQRPMSRAELLRRLEELRKRDTKKKVQGKERQPGPRSEPKVTSARAAVPAKPQPYSGVEMKYRNGEWVQMHPESE